MDRKKFKELKETIDSNIDSMLPNQFITLAETVLKKYPLSCLDYFTIKNNGEDINVGFRKPDCECPFCKYDLKTGKKKGPTS